MLTLHAVEELAERIERAYLRRQPRWSVGCSNSRVWATAAVSLIRLHRNDPTIPLDPELFVASQPIASQLADPWVDLAHARSARRYRRKVHKIIRKLRNELRAEVRQAESRVRLGEALEDVLFARSRFLSPLGRYIVAHRAGQFAIAEKFRALAQDQHRSCPLYRHACKRLITRGAYPVRDVVSVPGLPRRAALPMPQFSLN